MRIVRSFKPYVRYWIAWEPKLYRTVVDSVSDADDLGAGMGSICVRANFFQANSAAGFEVTVQHVDSAWSAMTPAASCGCCCCGLRRRKSGMPVSTSPAGSGLLCSSCIGRLPLASNLALEIGDLVAQVLLNLLPHELHRGGVN